MVTLKTIQYITCDDVEKLTGIHCSEFEFAQMAANDSYQVLDCDEEYLKELYEELEDEEDTEYGTRIKNQIKLIEILRKDFDCHSSILIWICW